MAGKDDYYNRAKQQGYRARSAYKLKQLDREFDLIERGDTVVDLGAAPGGWLQVAAEEAGGGGRVIGVDLQRIDDVERGDAPVETIRGDMTEDDTKAAIREAAGGRVDVVVSDMAPNMTGEYNLDHARSVHLARQALETAEDLLGEGGSFAVKVFQGQDLADFEADVEREFAFTRTTSPDASRESSSEVYVVGKNKLTGPVRVGDELTVEVTDVGEEGDGIAKVEGFTLFVDGAEAGDELRVEVTDVKPRFGFAEPIEE
ncbi:23S rRNA (uridine2552-2'-O)-methyltransferase [Halarchaeum rubridurum]|uniref:Ribosomal RNA large subunit methyltransferase E n=1 Tax=Halarchaeum rubridurum TaxID=489911 RepID=A0A830FYB9_9EURY|nr:23S rRNA (uridine(2552)-2'-O)-methyltransferase [Halarchaeum rubridurum]MBP1954306.1 23S rRNA (uridine2552-2'-O)-methyltransferase [Halarchaeum rubridurum]GGM58997.1 23S rRNA methyltransferase [Halarchaeum rubridurum]